MPEMGSGATQLIIGSVLSLLFALVGCETHRTHDPVQLLHAAIEAHGGRERLAQLDDLKVVSEAVFKGQLPLRRTVHWRGAQQWAMALELNGQVAMRLGIADGQCWKKDRHLASRCPDGESEMRRIAALFDARLLHHIDAAQVRPAAAVEVDGVVSPALRAGELVLVFNPATHRLVQIRLEDRIDSLSDYRSIGGAMIAAHRVLTIDGELDIEETWMQIEPGGADANALRMPDLPRAGLVIEEPDLPRPVAWMEIDDPERDAQQAVAQLDEFIQGQRRPPSGSDGVILISPPEHDGVPAGRWRIAVGVEANTPLSPVAAHGMHMEEWPAIRFLGVFHHGDSATVYAQRPHLQRLLQERNLVAARNAHWQILLSRDALGRPPAERLSLLRIALQ